MLTGGSLCTGSGGLDLGLERALGIRWLWHSEPDPHASRVLDVRWPGVPNLGDLFAVDWSAVERPHVLAAGFPCPDYSLAGKRAGIGGDHGQVWFGVAAAVRALRPGLLVLENVPGIRTARGLDDDAGESALGVVLADLAALGYDACWSGLRASDLGAPHGRDRWFLVGALAPDAGVRRGDARAARPGRPAPPPLAPRPAVDGAADALPDGGRAAADAGGERLDRVGGRDEASQADDRQDGGGALRDLPDLLDETAADAERRRREQHDEEERELPEPRADGELGAPGRPDGERLLPTPVGTDSFGSRRSTARTDEWTSHPGTSLTDAIWEVQGRETDTRGKLLPTPTAEDGERGRNGAGDDRLGAATFDDEPRLLPTPQAADGDGGRQEKGAMGRDGKRPSGQKATLPLPTAVSMREEISATPFSGVAEDDGQIALLPTPVANPENPGTGGELRAAIVHGEGRRNETGIDTLGRPNEGRKQKLLPTPDAQLGDKRGPRSPERAATRRERGHQDSTEDAVRTLLPTPNTRDHHAQGATHNEAAYSTALSTLIQKKLPTPTATDGKGSDLDSRQGDPSLRSIEKLVPLAADGERSSEVSWGVYEGAVRRWEAISGRAAPAPTDEKGRLDPPFPEWMLGYPAGWVTDVEGVSRTAQLRILGNSVQVQCGEAVGEWLAFLLESGLLPDPWAEATA